MHTRRDSPPYADSATLSDANQGTAAPPAQLDSPIHNFSVPLSSAPCGARLGHLLTTEQLLSGGLPLEAANHIVAKLVANATTHGRVSGHNFRLALYVVGDTLGIEVTDTRGDRLPRLGPVAPEAESGGNYSWRTHSPTAEACVGAMPRKTIWAELAVGGTRHPQG